MKRLLLAALFLLPVCADMGADSGILDVAVRQSGGVQAEEETSDHAVLLPGAALAPLPHLAPAPVQSFAVPAEPDLPAPPAPPDRRRA